ncbi:zinc-binding alcohol dehydrogenase family protein [Actinoplanes sp. NPDC051494]|uniref:zinc-binding alcohol dehydrogenase family protein n=1 Tax=Actinoplanes sp. NPDC051494 TaxID=3363907 RepID=UPI0037A01DC1
MRRVRFFEYGDPDVLTLEETGIPSPGPGEVLIRAEAIGANFVDTRFRRGPSSGAIFRRPLPGTLTGDVVGVVDKLGEGVDPSLLGRRVAALAEDAFADFAVTQARWVTVVPDDMDAVSASMLPTAAPVALRVLRTGGLGYGDTVLVHSAAGTIGRLALRLARISGAGLVIGTASTSEKLAAARREGADIAVDYTAQDWPDQVREAAPDGVHVVVEAVGGDVLRRSVELLRPYGKAVTYGAASGDLSDVPVTSLYALRFVAGFSLLAWRAAAPDRARAEMDELARMVAAGRLTGGAATELPLSEAAEAHRLLESRSHLGRILLRP